MINVLFVVIQMVSRSVVAIHVCKTKVFSFWEVVERDNLAVTCYKFFVVTILRQLKLDVEASVWWPLVYFCIARW